MKRVLILQLGLSVLCLLALLCACQEMGGPAPLATTALPLASATPTATAAPAISPQDTPELSAVPAESAPPSPVAPSTWTPTALPTSTPEAPHVASTDQVVLRETNISLSTYQYEPFLRQAWDEAHGVPYLWLDRSAYEELSLGSTVLRPFRAVLLENRYLRLTILPELGGRLYECFFKPAGQNLLYNNRVLKPTAWGPLAREQNWWLAAGGMEWAFPVNEHGYEWGVPWSYQVETSAEGATPPPPPPPPPWPRVQVEISLAPGTAYFTVRPHVENPTTSSISFQYWTNAMLTLGGSSMSPNTEFVYPAEDVVIHSAGPNAGLPAAGTTLSWPVCEGRDLSWYYNWKDWLGLFAAVPGADFVGAYNHDTGLGIARVFSPAEVPGVKLFAWGQGSPYVTEYTDDGSQYFEMWGGPNQTFWPEDDITLEPGGSRTWIEYWYPFQGIGGLEYANREFALNLYLHEGSLCLGLATTRDQSGTVSLDLGGTELLRRETQASPDSPQIDCLPLPPGLAPESLVSFSFADPEGDVAASYQTELGSLAD
jgi:hypothetical protein